MEVLKPLLLYCNDSPKLNLFESGYFRAMNLSSTLLARMAKHKCSVTQCSVVAWLMMMMNYIIGTVMSSYYDNNMPVSCIVLIIFHIHLVSSSFIIHTFHVFCTPVYKYVYIFIYFTCSMLTPSSLMYYMCNKPLDITWPPPSRANTDARGFWGVK